jgi:amino-acid N-acetyltransferase
MKDLPLIRARPPKSIALALLQAAKLPTEDLEDRALDHFFFSGSEGSPTAVVGLELYGSDALLRSLVVDERARGRGLGASLLEHAERYAADHGVTSLYLLTNTAESFFKRRGYTRIDRSVAPPSIKDTREYSNLCPQSSAFMFKQLKSAGVRT